MSQAATAYEKAISLEPDQAYAKTRLAQLKKIKQNKSKQSVTSKKSSVQPVRDHGGAYEIQMGAFQVRKNAEKMVKDLADKGYSARIFEIERSDKRV
ncbi:MAG: SPOR domain-containing protein [Desulfobacter sp.]|nr:MAG: SPOR domain-containing protein [Desulfobacter sp.]